jgi:hypothetical protein
LVAGSSGLGGEEITEEFKAEVKALLPISADGSIHYNVSSNAVKGHVLK